MAAVMGGARGKNARRAVDGEDRQSVHEDTDPAREKRLARGKKLEPFIIDMVIDKLAPKVTRSS